jgi:hypothetical protein
MMPDEITGVVSCPDCTTHREKRFAAEHRFWRLSSLMITCIGQRANQRLPGTDKTWAEAFTQITGVDYAEAVTRQGGA